MIEQTIKEQRFVNVKPTLQQLHMFQHEELREIAKELNVKRGRLKHETVTNLIASGRIRLCASLGRDDD